jgi:hypothetical protein
MRNCVLISLFAFVSSCSVSHMLPGESPLLPHPAEGKWWIINSVSKDKKGKDIHLCALISMESYSGKNYGGCFLSTWSEADSVFSSGVQNSSAPSIKFKEEFPFSISNSVDDSVSSNWDWTLKRNETSLQITLNKEDGAIVAPASLKASLTYATQKPFVLAHMLSSPDTWIAKPLNADVSIHSDTRSMSSGKLFMSAISGKTVLFERARRDFVTWMDISLNSGEQLSLLFRTDNKGNVTVDAAMLWDKNGNFMLRNGIEVQTNMPQKMKKGVGSKLYPLYYSISLPGDNIIVSERPRTQNQEVVNNKSSFWMGAVEVVDPKTGVQHGRGNMYIFKQ